MTDAQFRGAAALAAKRAHAIALDRGETPGGAFDIACAAYVAVAPSTRILEVQATIAEAIGRWRRDALPR
jgi:hypothetical protein